MLDGVNTLQPILQPVVRSSQDAYDVKVGPVYAHQGGCVDTVDDVARLIEI